ANNRSRHSKGKAQNACNVDDPREEKPTHIRPDRFFFAHHYTTQTMRPNSETRCTPRGKKKGKKKARKTQEKHEK
ncbi:hypothetical protein OFB61_23615, partial [Escherichia coli]|nr:hypothetical protein [Escherichia coli]